MHEAVDLLVAAGHPDGASVVLASAGSSIQGKYHSKLGPILDAALACSSETDILIRTAIRLRNHGQTYENAEPLLATLLEHVRGLEGDAKARGVACDE